MPGIARTAYTKRVVIMSVVLTLLLGLMLAACGDNTATPAPANTTAASAATTAAATTAASAATTAAATTAATTAAAPANTTAAASNGPAETVEMWIMPNTGQSVQDMQKALADFYTQNPNIKVNVTEVGWGDAFGKIQTALQTGVGPDITQVGTTWVATFGSTGGLRPFTDAEIQAVGGSKAFTEAAWNTTHLVGSKDIVAMPWFVETRAIVYRTDILKKAGLDASTAFKDWDTFTASIKKMKDTEGDLAKAPFAYTGKNDYNVIHNIMPWIWSTGGNILNQDNSKAAINSDAAVKGLQFYAGLYTQGLSYQPAIEKGVDDLSAMYRAGEVASYIDGPWMIARAKHTKAQDANGFADSIVGQNFGTAMMPAGPNGVHPFVGGSDLAILKSSKHADAAVKVVQYLASKKGQIAYQSILGDLPANLEAQSDPIYSDPLYKPYLESLKVGYSYPVVPAWGAIEQDLQKTFSSMWDDVVAGKGNDAIKQRLDQAAQEIDTAIENAK
ncbi:MAG TPA: sugar ABC transporter substrate-binding protein [Chloroflexia bacterium]|nr:sugar ABC transporter substrate-binding protein [Chloroflexia bacterium]